MNVLIGVDIGSYVFDSSAKTVTINGLQGAFTLEQIKLITNVTDGVIIFNFAESTGTLLANVLTLTYNTASMDDSDRLAIVMDVDQAEFAAVMNPSNVIDAELCALSENSLLLLRQILAQLNLPLWYVAASNALNTVIASGTVTTVSTVTSVTNQAQIGGITADPVIPSLLNDVWANSVRSLLS
jgi:hypothetical protein